MAATGIGNPVGYVPAFDGGNPRIITGEAMEVISGGVFVFASGAGAVSSGLDSFAASDIKFAKDASGNQFNGIAVTTKASGANMAVATRGACILVANGTVTAGTTVLCDGNNSVATGATAGTVIGRALVSAASGAYCLVDIQG